MMALKSPLGPSPNGSLNSPFSPWTGSSKSPPATTTSFSPAKRTSSTSDTLAPPPSPYPQHVDPSPTDSNGTESTDIDQEEQENDTTADTRSPPAAEGPSPSQPEQNVRSPTNTDHLAKIDTSIPLQAEEVGSDDAPPSVIHAPSGFRHLEGGECSPSLLVTAPPVAKHESLIASPSTPDPIPSPYNRRTSLDRTRRASVEEGRKSESSGATRASSTSSSKQSLDDSRSDHIATMGQSETGSRVSGTSLPIADEARERIDSLHTALSECWTFCNTLANLSAGHRTRMFARSNTGGVQEAAWRTCWRLCRHLYESQDEQTMQVQPTLDLCRDFCQALHDARVRGDEASDSILRTSFAINDHLYNIQAQDIPQSFRQRTLDFYMTMCHRMMKQRTSLPEETDALLRACWNLAETLSHLRSNHIEGRASEEELLSAAVQACWDLCDLFREGWSQVRPNRTTPRPSQTDFRRQTQQAIPKSDGRTSSLSNSNSTYHDAPPFPPETPVTIFDDVTEPSSPDESVHVPNILVLGPAGTISNGSGSRIQITHHDRWSSDASSLQDQSDTASASASRSRSSRQSSSTATAGDEEVHLLQLRALILKAATKAGYDPTGTSRPTSSTFSRSANSSARSTPLAHSLDRSRRQLLPSFVESLTSSAFGAESHQHALLAKYKALVTADPSLHSLGQNRQVTSKKYDLRDIAQAVRWLSGRDANFGWMRDLFAFVFRRGVDDICANDVRSRVYAVPIVPEDIPDIIHVV